MHLSQEITAVAQEIQEIAHPAQMILFSSKNNLRGEITSFKLCLVCPVEKDRKSALEREIYLTVDSPIPYDLVLYTTEEFESLKQVPGSFAHRVEQHGQVIQ